MKKENEKEKNAAIIREYLAEIGRRGGKIGGSKASREDKQRAGAAGGRAGKGKKKPRKAKSR
jgi:general stress protein YciG